MNGLVRNFTWLLGIILIAIGVLGFFQNPVLGLFAVDTTHNIVHLLSGIVGVLAAASGASYSRLYLIVFGVIYALVAILGFAMNGDILGLFVVNQADNYLHSGIALASLGIGFGSKK